jgi:CheY-like chemotaxis protein
MPAPAPIDDAAALERLQDLITQHTRRLHILERQAATYGPLRCPPEIEMEIEDAREQIAELLRRANALAEQVRFQRRRWILICDPNIQVADFLRRGVKRHVGGTYDVLSVFTSADVLTIARLWPIALLIIEVRLYDQENTLAFIQTFKAQAPGAVVMLLTNTAAPGLEEQARQHGVDYYLVKPIGLTELGDTVRQALGDADRPPL